jgi:hypothetical protein
MNKILSYLSDSLSAGVNFLKRIFSKGPTNNSNLSDTITTHMMASSQGTPALPETPPRRARRGTIFEDPRPIGPVLSTPERINAVHNKAEEIGALPDEEILNSLAENVTPARINPGLERLLAERAAVEPAPIGMLDTSDDEDSKAGPSPS